MKFKFNPLTGEFNLVPDSGTLKQKLNWLTGNFNLTKDAGKYKQIYNVIEGEFNLRPAITQVIVHGVGSIQLTNAVENGLLSLKAFGGTEQVVLPSGYTEVEYIQGDGTARIDLNTAINQDDEISIKFSCTGSITGQNVFGGRTNASSQNVTAFFAGTANRFVLDFNNSDYAPYRAIGDITAGTVYDVVINKTVRQIKNGDTVVFENATACEDTINLTTAYLFFASGSPTYPQKFTGKIYSCKIAGKINLIPCKDSNNVVGMYDIINGVFYVNSAESGSFTAGPNAVPTPATPVDIVCNNGVLKAIHQSGLPIGYTLLDYIKSGGSNYIDTGIKITNEDIIEMQYLQTADKGAIYGEYYNGTSNMSTTLYGNVTFYFYGFNAGGNATAVGDYDTNVHTIVHNFVDGYIDFDGVRTNFDLPNPNSFTNTLNCPIFGRSNGSSIGYFSKTQLYYFRIRRNGTLILDLIPAKDSNNNVGMYDRVSGTLFTESGSGSFTAGNTVADPMTVYADGITETIGVHGKNLSNGALENVGYTSTGGTSTSTTFCGNLCKIKCKEGEKYTVSCGNFPDGVSGVFISTWKTDGTFNLRQAIAIGSTLKYTYTIPSNISEVNFTLYKTGGITIGTNSWLQVEKGDTATPYQPYFDGGTATAEMLLKIGNYVDEQEILSGNITRKVGVYIFDGTERFSLLSSGAFRTSITPRAAINTELICTHYLGVDPSISTANQPDLSIKSNANNVNTLYIKDLQYNTEEGLQAYLASQYNAGTPVILVYELEEPTTETVAGQPLNIPAGDSTIEIVQASLDNLELEATYEQEA